MSRLPDLSKMEFTNAAYTITTRTIVDLFYWIFCIAIVCLCILSAFVSFQISIACPGIIRPSAEISIVRSAVNGRMKEFFLRENQYVRFGDTLYSIESESLNIRKQHLSANLAETNGFTSDLRKLVSQKVALGQLYSTLYRQSYLTYLQKLEEASIRHKKIRKDFNRNLNLHRENVIADAEFETHKFDFDRATNDVALIIRTQMNQWQTELTGYERELLGIESELAQVEGEIDNLVIRAPISGTVQNLVGIYPGSIVYANQDLAQISPDTNLIVEAYVSPNDIGLLHDNMNVRFYVDAFNFNQWGAADGKVTDISNDIHLVNDRPAFKIRCSLGRNYLQLKNGYKGNFRKGMSLQVRIIVVERTLWQLLYDQMDDWLNPNRQN